jgi:PIN domain nuclease of toxin-antitoxin system
MDWYYAGPFFLRPPRTTPEGLSRTFHCPVAILSRKIPLPHQNPADQFIAATAIYYELNLATVDAQLTGYSGIQTLS